MISCPVCDKELGASVGTCPACGTELGVLNEMELLPQTLLADAEKAQNNGDDATALSYCTIALEMRPNDIALIRKCAELKEKAGDSAGALRLWSKLKTDSDPDPHIDARIAALSPVAGPAGGYAAGAGGEKVRAICMRTVAVLVLLLAGWGGHHLFVGYHPPEADTIQVTMTDAIEENIEAEEIADTTLSEDREREAQRQQEIETEKRLAALSNHIRRDLPETVGIESYHDGLKLTGWVDFPWEKDGMEAAAESWDCGFVDLRQVAVKYPNAFQYRIQRGDTLYDLCRRFNDGGASWPEVYELNQDLISDPNRLITGDTIILFTNDAI